LIDIKTENLNNPKGHYNLSGAMISAATMKKYSYGKGYPSVAKKVSIRM